MEDTPVVALPVQGAWSLVAREAVARVDPGQWAHQARTFFRAEVRLVPVITSASGELPSVASLEFDVAHGSTPADVTRVRVVTVPLDHAPGVRAAADAGVHAMGGGGFEHLVARAVRAWQVQERPVAGTDSRAPLVMAAVLALVLLAPIVPPGGGPLFGVKGARTRLENAGWT